jgi:hypothetical protein
MSDSYRFPADMFHQRNLAITTVTSLAEMDDFLRRGYLPNWHRRHPLGWDYCDAGWRAFFGGHWREYCPFPGTNIIGSESKVVAIVLCESHFSEVNAAKLVTEVNIGEDAFYRRYGGADRPV